MTQTIGQRLKAEREEKRLTLEKVFEATRIRVQYLRALEADDLSLLPSPVQARGYLRNYSEFLGLDFESILEEMHLLSTQKPSGKVIGPADETVSTPQKKNEFSDAQSLKPVLESFAVLEEKPASIEEPASSPSFTVPIKPKPARRKKADSTSQLSSVETPTKRRGRKKAEPDIVEASIPQIESVFQSESVENVVVPIEIVTEPEPSPAIESDTIGDQARGGPVAEEAVEKQPEETTPIDASDTLWQSWLNRLGSVMSARRRRQTLITNEAQFSENEVIAPPAEPELEAETQGILQENSLEILKNIGRDLRERRELLSLHFDEVERNTHVKAHYLDALERGALDDLPSTVQTRGMLSNYATFLDLDVDALLLRFADALQARHRERNPQKPARKPGQPIIANIPPVRTFIAGDMIFGVSMAILLVGFAIWGVSRVMAVQSQREVKPTAPSISDVLLASPDPSLITVTPTFLPVESIPGEATVTVEIPTQNVNAEVQLNLVAVERTYMRVVVDGKVAFEGRVVPGNAYPFEAESQIEVLVGNGAAIRTVYNGRDLGLMGTFGQVVNNIYLGTEIITPTALSTATPTVTITPTRTAPPTTTSGFTATPAPSPSATPVP